MPKARETFIVGRRVVHAGDVVPKSDPIYRKNAELFEAEVEQATAAPGEKRNVKKVGTRG